MRFLVLILGLMLGLSACKSASAPPVLTAVESAVCDVESSITGVFGSQIVTACGGPTSAAAACGAAFQTALGNANLCSAPVAAVTVSQIATAKAKFAPKGVIGSVACPLAIGAVFGVLSTQIPSACGCTQSLSASSLDSLLVSACEAAVPI